MPEELAILVIVLVAVVWGIFALIGGVTKVLGEAQRSFVRNIAANRERRFSNRKIRLARAVQFTVPDDLSKAEREVQRLKEEFQRQRTQTVWTPVRPAWERRTFLKQRFSPQRAFCSEMNIAEIDRILSPEVEPWVEKESALLTQECSYPCNAPTSICQEFHEFVGSPLQIAEAIFDFDPVGIREKDIKRYFQDERTSVDEYNQRRLQILSKHSALIGEIESWNIEERKRWKRYLTASASLFQEELDVFRQHAKRYSNECQEQREHFNIMLNGFRNGVKESVIGRIECILGSLVLPASVPRLWEVDFDDEEGILIVEVGLPDVVHRPPAKFVQQKNGLVAKPLNQSERKEYIPKVHPAILLRVGFEIARNDTCNVIKLLVLNGWVNFREPATGSETKAYTASLMVEPRQLEALNLQNLDPVVAFENLHGKSAGKLIDIIPIEPMLALKKADSRFVDGRQVLNSLDNRTNLAQMDWQEFEHLIRELFDKEFSGRGAEVKITQASRDRGVDAIAFDPDPIRGGKYVIQAKCYTNTVDVSAVRDLCAVVRKEGASRGILVTTSTYGAEAYVFANNEPVTLLNGAELLGLLKKHGYDFRINLAEARQMKLHQIGKEDRRESHDRKIVDSQT
jgi:HJR/Mrr/RecB family endonuclease